MCGKNKTATTLIVVFLVLLIVGGAGYFYFNSTNFPKINLILKNNIKTPQITIELSPAENLRTPTTTVIAIIKKDGIKVAETKTLNGTPVTLEKQTKKYAYFRLGYPTGIGGYSYSYFGHLASLDLKTNEWKEFIRAGSYVLDIGSNDVIVWGQQGNHLIVLEDFVNKTSDKINVPTKYNRIQQALFSPDGSKIAYVVGETTNPFSNENEVLFVSDIKTKAQTKMLDIDLLAIDQWIDNQTLQVKQWASMSEAPQVFKLLL